MRPKIFAGREGKYNEAILKALYEKGYLTPWNIAREIAIGDPRRKPKEDPYHKMQKINSVLVRKDGRLSDLVNKEFIEKTERGYCLTFNKGFCTALVLYEEDIPKPAIDETSKIETIFPELKEVIDIISRHYPELIPHEMRESTSKLLSKGLDFEKISNKEFNVFFDHQFQEQQLTIDRPKYDTPPELKEALLKLISRLMSSAQKEFKKLEELQNDLSKNIQLESVERGKKPQR